MYPAVRTALLELSTFEDIIQAAGSQGVVPGDVGLFASVASDVWGLATPPNKYGQHWSTFLAGKRALYIALLHAELAVDILVEEDTAATLQSYKYIFLADTHVTQLASKALETWVAAGGVLIGTAGAGMFDEFNNTNTVLEKVFGINGVAMIEPQSSAIQYIKQDLRFAVPLGHVQWNNKSMTAPIVGARHVFTIDPASAPGVSTIATLDDDASSPIFISNKVMKGKAVYLGFLPGFSYFLPAIPKRPADRGGTDEAFTHFVPSSFDEDMLRLLISSTISSNYVKQLTCANNLVQGRPVAAAGRGVVIPLVNWSGEPFILNLVVELNLPGVVVKAQMKAQMASGTPVALINCTAAGFVRVSIGNMSVADALILR
jgi:hypothetical protein